MMQRTVPRNGYAMFTSLLAVAILSNACSDGIEARRHANQTSNVVKTITGTGDESVSHKHGTTLLVNIRDVISLQAEVTGQLKLNPRGCVTLNNAVVIAPFGSRVVSARTFSVPGSGMFAIGQKVKSSGGLETGVTFSDLPQPFVKCFGQNVTDGQKPPKLVTVDFTK